MSALTLSARLDRSDPNTPWGFRMAGGKDYGQPLTIQRVTPGSLASKCGLQVGDAITKIGGMPTDSLKHKDAQSCIIQGGNSVELALTRGGSFSRPPVAVEPAYEPSQPSYSAPPSSWNPENFPPSTPQAQNQNYNTAPKPFSPAAGTMPVAVNKQYNTPINMYSVGNVMDSLATQTAGMNVGGGPGKLEDSDVYKLVHEEESGPEKPEHACGTNAPPATPNSTPSEVETPASPDGPPPPINTSTFPGSKPPPNQKPAGLSVPKKAGLGTGKTSPVMSARYEEVEGDSPQYKGYTNPSMQSRSFKLLQGLVESGEDVTQLSVGRKDSSPARSPILNRRSSASPHLMGPKPYSSPSLDRKDISVSPKLDRRSSSPVNNNNLPAKPSITPVNKYAKGITNNQYNSPLGLYAKNTATEILQDQSKILMEGKSTEPEDTKTPVISTTAPESPPPSLTAPPPLSDTVAVNSTRQTIKVSPERNTITVSPKRDTITVTPKRDTITVTPKRDTITVSPKRDTITITPTRDTITVTPERKKIVVPSLSKTTNGSPTTTCDGKKVYRPSETFKMVQKADAGKDDTPLFGHVRRQDSTDGGKVGVVAQSLTEDKSSSQQSSGPLRDAGFGLNSNKIQSRSFRMLEQQLDNQAPAGPPHGGMGAPSRPSPAATAPRPSPAAAPAARPSPAAAPASRPAAPSGGGGGGAWQPKIPTGPRNMKVGRAGEVKTFTTPQAGKIPVCSSCGITIRGPFILALDRTWCPDHFNCSNPNCRRPLVDCGFVEEEGQLFCEADYRQFFAPRCSKCGEAIIGDRVSALDKEFHPRCFTCSQCHQAIAEGQFHQEGDNIYCNKDWQAMFQTKCHGCDFPIEPGDRWVEALGGNWHSECFNCSSCQMSLEGQSFFAKGGKPYCKKHAMGKKF